VWSPEDSFTWIVTDPSLKSIRNHVVNVAKRVAIVTDPSLKSIRNGTDILTVTHLL